MPELNWKRSVTGGMYCIDEHGNKWTLTANGEVYTVMTQDGRTAMGWTPGTAWNALEEAA